MSQLRTDIIARIKANTPTAALLDEFELSAGVTTPAVFPKTKPEGYEWKPEPGVIVRDPTMIDDTSPFGGRMADALISVAIYGQLPANSNDDDKVQQAATSVFELFRRKSFTGGTGILYQANASGPIAAPVSTPQLTGLIVQLRVNVGD